MPRKPKELAWRFSARECLSVAKQVRTPATKRALERMAASYRDMADRIEELHRRQVNSTERLNYRSAGAVRRPRSDMQEDAR